MKRVSCVALGATLSLPFVFALACTHGEPDAAAASDNLSEETKKACSFAFTEAPVPEGGILQASTLEGLSLSKAVLVGDWNGDGKNDLAIITGAGEVRPLLGKGDGTFAVGAPVTTGEGIRATSGLAVGDFDGDGRQDLAVLVTTETPAAGETPAVKVGRYVVLYGNADGSLDAIPQALPEVTPKNGGIWHLTADLDGDGKDDLVIANRKTELVAFGGGAERALITGPKLAVKGTRELAFVAKTGAGKRAKSALFVATKTATTKVTFGGERSAELEGGGAAPFAEDISRVGGDLDTNGSPEIATLDPAALTFTPFGAGAGPAARYEGMSGRLLEALDLDENGRSELLYANEGSLWAACGYAADANAVAATPLGVPLAEGASVVGHADFTGDGKADLVTVGKDGSVRVYLAGPRPDRAAPLTIFGAASREDPDAAVDAPARGDGGPSAEDAAVAEEPDATATNEDASSPDSPADAPDAMADAVAPKNDGGTPPKPPTPATDQSDEAESDPPRAPGTSPKAETKSTSDRPARTTQPGTAGSDRTGPRAAEDGCSATPGLARSPFGAASLLAALLPLALRRRRAYGTGSSK